MAAPADPGDASPPPAPEADAAVDAAAEREPAAAEEAAAEPVAAAEGAALGAAGGEASSEASSEAAAEPEPEASSEAAAEASSEAEAAAEPEPEAEAEAAAEAEPEAEAAAEPEPEAEAAAEVAPEAEAAAEAEPEAEAAAEPEPEAEAATEPESNQDQDQDQDQAQDQAEAQQDQDNHDSPPDGHFDVSLSSAHGLSWALFDNNITVTGVARDAPAFAEGVQSGHRLVAIDGRAVHEGGEAAEVLAELEGGAMSHGPVVLRLAGTQHRPDFEEDHAIEELEAVITSERMGVVVENVAGHTIVTYVEPGGPGEQGGMREGTMVVGVNAVSVLDRRHMDVVSLLKASGRPLLVRLRVVPPADLERLVAEHEASKQAKKQQQKAPAAEPTTPKTATTPNNNNNEDNDAAWAMLTTALERAVEALPAEGFDALAAALELRNYSPAELVRTFRGVGAQAVEFRERFLSDLAAALGGVPYNDGVVALLELVVASQATTAWLAAVQSLQQIVPNAPEAAVRGALLPALHRLAAHDVDRCLSACVRLLPPLYARVGAAEQAELQRLFDAFASHREPEVRASAAVAQPRLAAVVTPADGMWVLGALQVLASDADGLVRSYVAKHAVAVAAALAGVAAAAPADDPEAEVLAQLARCQLLPIMSELAGDQRWQVRDAAAQVTGPMLRELGAKWTDVCVDLQLQLLRDSWYDVRRHAVEALPDFVAALRDVGEEADAADASAVVDRDSAGSLGRGRAYTVLHRRAKTVSERICGMMLPAALSLLDDFSEDVRAAAAESLGALVPFVSEQQLREHFVPVFAGIFRADKSHVRAALVGTLSDNAASLGAVLRLEVVLPELRHLAADARWRNREEAAHAVALYARSLGLAEAAVEPESVDAVTALCFALLDDEVAAVRDAAAEALSYAAYNLGAAWLTGEVLPRLQARLGEHTPHRNRVSAAHALRCLAAALPAPLVAEHVVPLLVRAAADRLANVRVAVARALAVAAACVGVAVESDGDPDGELQVALACLQRDEDQDVWIAARGWA